MRNSQRQPLSACIACNIGKLQCDADVWHGDPKCCAWCSHPEWIG